MTPQEIIADVLHDFATGFWESATMPHEMLAEFQFPWASSVRETVAPPSVEEDVTSSRATNPPSPATCEGERVSTRPLPWVIERTRRSVKSYLIVVVPVARSEWDVINSVPCVVSYVKVFSAKKPLDFVGP